MRRRLFIVLLALAPATVQAAADCDERCTAALGRCAGTCGVDGKCVRRCQDQQASCQSSCMKSDKLQPQRLPTKCPGPNGRTIPCPDYFKKPSTAEVYKIPPAPKNPNGGKSPDPTKRFEDQTGP